MIPRQVKENGITKDQIKFDDNIVDNIIGGWTAESGVRNLERSIGTICRTVAYSYATSKDLTTFQKVNVDKKLVEEALGIEKYDFILKERIRMPGVAIGLAYTSIGGRALLVETTKYPGSG